MTVKAYREGRRLHILVSGQSNDAEILGCVLDALKQPDFDIVDRALADVTALESYEVVATVRVDIFVHLIGLFCTREGLRVAIVYADLEMGELGRCLAEFCSMAGRVPGRGVGPQPGRAGCALLSEPQRAGESEQYR